MYQYDITVHKKRVAELLPEYKAQWPSRYWTYLATLKEEYGKQCPEITCEQLKNKMATKVKQILYLLHILSWSANYWQSLILEYFLTNRVR